MLECIWNRLHSRSFTIFFSTVIVAAPVVVISYSFVRIFLYVRASRNRVTDLISTADSGHNDKRNIIIPPHRTSVHLAITLAIIFLVFVVCWAPYALLVLIDHQDRLSLPVYLYILLLAHLHASLNCFVYAITNKHFRQAYIFVISQICKCQYI